MLETVLLAIAPLGVLVSDINNTAVVEALVDGAVKL